MSPNGRPLNVLWIMSDQHSSRALGCYGNPIVQTPRLDRLAAEGMLFERAYCSYPVCVPARFTMLTGRYPHHHGAVGNRTPLPLRERTAAHHFAHAGYATAFLGKMHPVDAQTHGFDYYMDMGHYYDYLGPKTRIFTAAMGADDSGSGSPWLTIYFDRDRSNWVDPSAPRQLLELNPPEVLDEPDHFESFIARETVRFLRTYRDEPLFVVTSFLKPHNPFAPPREYDTYRPDDMPDVPVLPGDLERIPPQARPKPYPGAGTPAGDAWQRRFMAKYYGNVTHLDACIGRILDALDELDLTENTLVLYTTDHGDMQNEHGLRAKFNFFEPSANLPLIARLPGAIPAGRRTQALVDQADFVPTLLDACGVVPAARSQPLDGASFLPVLHDPDHPGKAFAFGEFGLNAGRPFYMRRDARWKYIYYTAPEPPPAGARVAPFRPTEELYDPVADPGEMHNLAGDEDYASVVAEQRTALLAYLEAQGAPLAPFEPPPGPIED